LISFLIKQTALDNSNIIAHTRTHTQTRMHARTTTTLTAFVRNSASKSVYKL